MKEHLILGIGNPILTDDGIGPLLVDALEKELDNSIFDFLWDYTFSLDLIPQISAYKSLFIIDGSKNQNKVPGEMTYFTIDNYPDTLHLDNYHDISLRDLNGFRDDLNLDIPSDIHIMVVNIIEDKVFSKELTIPVKEAFNKLVSKSKKYIEEVLKLVLIS